MVGDSLTRDIVGAARVGITNVWMRRYAHLEPMHGIYPDATVADLPSLRAWLSGSLGTPHPD
jgi:FMN phosphatase YigB (HAD superfamily)